VPGRELHLHSMMVHAVIALALIAATAYVCEATRTTVAGIAPTAWAFLLRGALVGIFALATLATVTGISERNHMYTNWHPSHRMKLMLSLILLGMTAAELATLGLAGHAVILGSWLALAVVVGNPVTCLALSYYGLRITLGRQALTRTSYTPDMDREPPVDILVEAAALAAEQAAIIEVQEESNS